MTRPPPHCGKPRKRGAGLCTQAAGWGTDHPGFGGCKLHGGSSPGGKTEAKRLMAEQAASRFALPRQIDPAQALLDEIAVTQGWVDWLRARIEELEPDLLVRGTRLVRRTESDQQGVTVVTEVGPGISEWWRLFQEQRAHLVKTSAAALAAGIARRQVELAEADGLRIAQAVRGILEELGMSGDPRVRDVVPRHLRAVRAAG